MAATNHEAGTSSFERLVTIVERLREPGGCPWDREQTHASLVPFVLEEAYEVADAIERGDLDGLREELGDVLLQVLLHARIAEEDGRFDIHGVAGSLADKLVARHPHVFGDETAHSAEDVTRRWERIKQEEKARKGDATGVLAGVPRALPALVKAQRLTEKAGRTGFDWPDAASVVEKLREEVAELEADVLAGRADAARAEFGDVLFVLANMARHLKIDAEAALQGANARFTARFEHVERRLRADGRTPAESTLAEMDVLWEEAKRLEAGNAGPGPDPPTPAG